MSNPSAVRRGGPGRWRRGRAVMSLGVFVLGVWVSALAVFTSSAAVGGNGFTTGTVDIAVSPASALLGLAAMAPGDRVTAPLTVSNLGTLALRYSMTSTGSGDAGLASGLAIDVRSGVVTCTNADFSGSGAAVTSGTLAAVAFGNPAQGSQLGDRALAAGASEVLCFQASLPLTAADALQGKTATGTFSFPAEQTANN